MMQTIMPIYLYRLRNDEHFVFVRRIINLITEADECALLEAAPKQ